MGSMMGQGDLYGGACVRLLGGLYGFCGSSETHLSHGCLGLSRHQQAGQHVMTPCPLWEDVAS